jgi:glycosylphosphatidylinositol deacylase
VDLNEDFSAFHGATIRDQAAFLVYSIHRVLNLYDEPKNVTLLGHSMGGIVARLAMSMGVEDVVDVILTMSTPHLIGPATLDSGIEAIYRTIKRSIRPALLSVCGGIADSQIASDTCAIHMHPSEGFTVFTTGLPGTWTGVDHQAMVWCHQVRWRIARVLLAMTTVNTKADRLAIAAKWLFPEELVAGTGGSSFQNIRIDKPTTFLSKRRPASVQLCLAGSCHAIDDARMEQIPIPKVGLPFPVLGEGSQPDDAGYALTVNTSGLVRLGLDDTDIAYGPYVTSTSRTNVWAASEAAAKVRVTFPRLSVSSLLVYRLTVDAPICTTFRPIIQHTSISADNVREDRYFPSDASDILLHSHSGSAPFISSRTQGLYITVYQSPECGVRRLTIRREIWRSLAKAITRFRMAVVAWSLGWAAVIAAVQFERSALGESGQRGSVLRSESARAWIDLPVLHILWVYVCLLSAAALQSVVPFTVSRHLLLGTDDVDALLLHMCIATWTLLSTLTAVFCFQSLAALCRKLFTRKDRCAPSRRKVMINSLLVCASMVLVPQEMLLLIVFAYQVSVHCVTVSRSRDGAESRVLQHLQQAAC